MKKSVLRVATLALAACTVTPFIASCSSCKKNERGPADEIDSNYQWLDTSLTDSSQLTSYSGGSELLLSAWNVSQTGGGKQYESDEDVVTEEIHRVTNVKIDEYFDNAGSTAADAFIKMAMSDEIPDMAYGSGWMEPNELWDLTELIDKYCPTIKARMPQSVWSDAQVNGGQEGKVYGIPYGLGNMSLSDLDPEADPTKTSMFSYANEPYPYIMVREDVLKEAYPQAKTTAEIEALFAQNGKFTEAELFDVPITSATQFRTEFLPNIQRVLDSNPRYTSANGRKVRAMMVTAGSDYDTWDFLGVLVPKLLGAMGTHTNTQFSYWDKQTQKIELMLTQDWYLNEVSEWAKIVNQGVYATRNEFTSNHNSLMGDLNSGFYAIGYQSSSLPAGNQAKYILPNGTEETVKYRKVYMQIPQNDHFEFFVSGTPAVSSVMFFKYNEETGTGIQEEYLPQLLRWLDYQCSRLADKVYAWGPSSAGLFTETNGVRVFNDATLADQMVYNTLTMGDLVKKYNLSNGTVNSAQPIFSFAFAGGSKDHPKCSYDLSQMSGVALSQFSSSVVCNVPNVKLAKYPSLHYWNNSDLDGVERIWSQRPLIEPKLKDLLLAGNGFSSAVTAMKNTLQTAGWTNEYFNGVYTNKFLQLNKDYLSQFYQG